MANNVQGAVSSAQLDSNLKAMTEEVSEEQKVRKSKTEPCVCQDGRIFNVGRHKWEPCPYCERALKWLSPKDKAISYSGKNINEMLRIPAAYRDTKNVGKEYITSFDWASRGYQKDSVDSVGEILFAISDAIYAGKIFQQSVFIYVPDREWGPDINKWVYSSMYEAITKGLSTAPFLTAEDIYDLHQTSFYTAEKIDGLMNRGMANLTVGERNDLGKLKTAEMLNVNYNNVLNCDILFIHIMDMNDKLWQTISNVLTRRANLLKPTYLISNRPSYQCQGAYYLRDTRGTLDKYVVYDVLTDKNVHVTEDRLKAKNESYAKSNVTPQAQARSGILDGISKNTFGL